MSQHRPHATRNVGSRTTPAHVEACKVIAGIVSQGKREGCTRDEIDRRIRAARPYTHRMPGYAAWESARRRALAGLETIGSGRP